MRRFTMAAFGLALLWAPPLAHAAPDAWITTKTKMALLTTENLPWTGINVDTVDGRVTLHGTVATEQAKTRAADVARAVEGVTDVQNLLQVVPSSVQDIVQKADGDIKTAVEQQLEQEPTLADADIYVQSVNDGVVLLAGEAPSMSAHLTALRETRQVPGVRRVETEVKAPAELSAAELRELNEADDSLTAKDIGSSVAAAAKSVGSSIRGAADETEDMAEDAAEGTAETAKDTGRSIGGALSDMRITARTKLKLIGNDETPALDINVDTTDGIVTLFGTVPSERAKQEAEQEAREVDGVKAVRNQLIVKRIQTSDLR